MLLKLTVLVSMIFGESLCIYSEMLMGKSRGILYPFVLITLAGIPLLFAYWLGYKAFQSMWPVMVLSMASVLVSEPLLIWFLFHEVPSKHSLIGLAFGLAGGVIVLSERT